MDDKLHWKDKLEIVVESGLQLVPTAGGSLSTLYFGTKKEKRFKRLENFYQEVSQQMNELNIKINNLHLHDEESLTHLIEEINESIEREHSETKRRLIKQFFINSIISVTNQSNFDERKFFLDCISSLSHSDIHLLQLLRQLSAPIVINNLIKDKKDLFAMVGSVNRLSNFGFVVLYQGTLYPGDFNIPILNQSIELSNYGKKFIQFCIE